MPPHDEHLDGSDRHEAVDGQVGVTDAERAELVPDLLARRFGSNSRSYWQIVWSDFRVRRPAVVAMWVIMVMAVMAVLAPLLANHRPFVLDVPKELANAPGYEAVSPGLQFPLLSSLGMLDWILALGTVLVLTAWCVRRRAARTKDAASPIATWLLLFVGVFPVLLATFVSVSRAAERAANNALKIPMQGWVVWAIIGLVGVIVFGRSIMALFTKKRDQLGNLLTGGAIFGAVVGGVLLLIASSWLGTRGQRAQDVTEYHSLAANDDVWAIFPPVQQDFLSAESFIKKQPPLGPYLRIQPSGGSSAAADLGLTDTRSHANLAAENTAAASDEALVPINAETQLSELRTGRGIRQHETAIRDFTIVAHSLERYSVSLFGTETIGDVIEKINSAAGGNVTAQINSTATRIELIDNTDKAPTNFLGTDSTGSDVAARLIHATRVALSIGFVSTGIALLIGITMGALMGYFGGWVDIAGMRIIEIFMAIPRLFLLLTIIAFIPPEWNDFMLYAMMAVIGATSWMGSARFIRAEFFKLRDQDFVQAAKACGLPVRSVLFKHMLPNGVTPVLVDASFGVAAAIFIETGLSFLGFGIKPPNPSWGQMLADAVDATGTFRWWMAVFPGIMIFLTVFAFNLVGDALRDAIDPKLKKAAA